MAGRPKNEPMTQAEMVAIGKQKRATSKIYRVESKKVTDEAISASINNVLAEIKKSDNRKKINLEDTEAVKRIAEDYLSACAVSATFPNMSSLAMALGCSRQNLYYFMEKKGDTETGLFLTQLHDLFSNILAENSLRNNANNITAIFLLKALFGYKDTTTFEMLNPSADFDPVSVNEISNRAGLLDD